MARPVVCSVSMTAAVASLLFSKYRLKLCMKWMVSSTARPMAMLPTSMVKRFMGILNQPMIPSMMIMGVRLGTMERRPMRSRPMRRIINTVMTSRA